MAKSTHNIEVKRHKDGMDPSHICSKFQTLSSIQKKKLHKKSKIKYKMVTAETYITNSCEPL